MCSHFVTEMHPAKVVYSDTSSTVFLECPGHCTDCRFVFGEKSYVVQQGQTECVDISRYVGILMSHFVECFHPCSANLNEETARVYETNNGSSTVSGSGQPVFEKDSDRLQKLCPLPSTNPPPPIPEPTTSSNQSAGFSLIMLLLTPVATLLTF